MAARCCHCMFSNNPQAAMQQPQPLVPIMAIPIQSANKFNIRILFDQNGQPMAADASGYPGIQESSNHQLLARLPPPASVVPNQQRVVVQADVHQPQQPGMSQQQWYQANGNIGQPTTIAVGDNRLAYTTSIPTSMSQNGGYVQYPGPVFSQEQQTIGPNAANVMLNGGQSNAVMVNNDYQQTHYQQGNRTVIQQYAEEAQPQRQQQQQPQQPRKRVTFNEDAETIEDPPLELQSPPQLTVQVEQPPVPPVVPAPPLPSPTPPPPAPAPPMPVNSTTAQASAANSSRHSGSNNKSAPAPSSSFDNALKENYKTYAKRTALGSTAVTPSEKESNTEAGKLKMTEVLASLMAPQETRVGLEANVRVALLNVAGRHVMIKIASQNGVTGIMEPAVYTALTDVAMTCAVLAEKARNSSHVVTFSGEELAELLAADRRLEKTATSLQNAGLVLAECVCVFDGDKWHVGTQCLDIVYRKAALTVAKSAVIVVLRPLNRLSPIQEFSGQVCSHILSEHPAGLQQPAAAAATGGGGEGLLTQKFASDPLITVAEAARRSYAEIVGFTLYGCI